MQKVNHKFVLSDKTENVNYNYWCNVTMLDTINDI